MRAAAGEQLAKNVIAASCLTMASTSAELAPVRVMAGARLGRGAGGY